MVGVSCCHGVHVEGEGWCWQGLGSGAHWPPVADTDMPLAPMLQVEEVHTVPGRALGSSF